MDPIHRQVLANMTTVIMNRISSPTVFAAYLKRIFSPSDIEEIKAKEIQMGAIQGAQTLLSLLEKRGPKAFVLFKDALRNPGNNMADLADELEAEEGRLRGKTAEVPMRRPRRLPQSAEPVDLGDDAEACSPPPPYSVPLVQSYNMGNGSGGFYNFNQGQGSEPVSKQTPAAETNTQALPEGVLTEVTLIIEIMLDPSDPNHRDWRGIACVMNLNSEEVKRLENDRINGKMKGLIERMIQKHKTVNDLLTWLRHPDVERLDVIDEIRKEPNTISDLDALLETESSESQQSAPLEILARGPLALQAYQEALVEGKTSVKRLPIMLIGQSQSGKTSLKRSLKGERFDPEERTTKGIEMDPSYCKLSTEVWKVGEKTQATVSDPAPLSYEQCTAQYIASTLEKRQEEQRKELKSNEVYKEHSSELRDASQPFVYDALNTMPGVPNVPELPEVPEEIAGLIEKLLQGVDNKEGEEEIYSVLWDFGGQSVYYATHPLFLTTRAIYCLVYNLSRNPDETVSPQVKHGFYNNVEDVFCEKSNMDYLDVWMSSVSSLVSQDESPEETSASEMLPERLPPVFLVCTHADKPYKNAHPEELAREIFGSLQTKPYGEHLTDVFVVDNTKSGSGQECPEVTRLRRDVRNVAKELPQMKEDIPIKWLKYEKTVTLMLEAGYKWISLKQARTIALDVCSISSDEQFLALLNFLHDQRILIHFDDTPELKEVVILDLQWLIDVFKEIITITPYNRDQRKFTKLWLKLQTTGILEEKLLQHVWGPLIENQETCNSLIAMMEKFCLLCPWSSSVEGESPKEYLVPSMLMFPPKEDVTELIASAGIPSLFVKFKSSQVPSGLFSRLVLMVFQWCTKEWLCQSRPQLHHNFARFFTHPAEGCSIIFLCHSSSIEVVVHKKDCNLEVSAVVSPEIKFFSESSYDTFQVSVARIVCRQLGLMLACMRKEFPWLKNMAYEMSVCCPVCCKQGSVNHCHSHKVRGCKQEECLHFWSESQLRECQEPIICTRSAVAGDYRVPVKIFGHWFKFVDGQGAIDGRYGRALRCKEGDSEQALVLPSGLLEALQLQTCDANGVVARLQESLSLEQASLEQPDPETKQQIRCLCMKAKTANRLDVVQKLREIAPAGTTGPLLPEALDVKNIPFGQRKELTINLCGRDEWKLFAERLGLSPAEILYLDKRVLNPCDAALAHSRNQGDITSVGDLYDTLVDCELPVMADLL